MDDQATNPEANTGKQSDAEQNKIMAVLAYFGLLVLIPLLAAKESEFAQYHANQGLILLIAGVATSAFSIIPIVGWIGGPIISLGLFVLAIIGIVNAVQGEMKELPLIGHFKLLN